MPPSTTSHRLRKHADYQRVYKAARKQYGKQIAYFAAGRLPESEAAQRSDTDGPRIGLTVPKALGNAVLRNRIKRRMREAVRQALPLLPAPTDVVLHPRKTIAACPFEQVQREVSLLFRAVQAASERPQPVSVSAAASGRRNRKMDRAGSPR